MTDRLQHPVISDAAAFFIKKIETPTGELVEATLENLEYYGYIRILN